MQSSYAHHGQINTYICVGYNVQSHVHIYTITCDTHGSDHTTTWIGNDPTAVFAQTSFTLVLVPAEGNKTSGPVGSRTPASSPHVHLHGTLSAVGVLIYGFARPMR